MCQPLRGRLPNHSTRERARRRAQAQFGGRDHDEGKYNVVLPGVHLKYELFPGLVTRASWELSRSPLHNSSIRMRGKPRILRMEMLSRVRNV